MNIKTILSECYQLASFSPDPSNQNGAIILNCVDQIISKGNNNFPPGTKWTPELIKDREWKLLYIEHAERSAIFELLKKGCNDYQGVMVCPWFSCHECSRAILLSGIKKVIGHKERMDMTPDRWKASVEAGHKILRDGGVELEFWSGKIGCEPIIVNGELWQP